jgi:hypothetical protein
MGIKRGTEAVPKKAAPKAKEKVAAKKAAKSEAAAMDKGEVANMLGSLKGSKDPQKQELLTYYRSLSRFDSQKSELLKKWKADRSCKWLAPTWRAGPKVPAPPMRNSLVLLPSFLVKYLYSTFISHPLLHLCCHPLPA